MQIVVIFGEQTENDNKLTQYTQRVTQNTIVKTERPNYSKSVTNYVL